MGPGLGLCPLSWNINKNLFCHKKPLEKGLNRVWWNFKCPFFTKYAFVVYNERYRNILVKALLEDALVPLLFTLNAYFPTGGAFLVRDYFKDFQIMKFVWKCFDKYLSENVLG